MTYEYTVTRTANADGTYDIDNSERIIDESGITLPEEPTAEEYTAWVHRGIEQIECIDEIKEAVPELTVLSLKFNHEDGILLLDREPTQDEDDAIQSTITAHKNNT